MKIAIGYTVFDRLDISMFDPSITDPSGFIQWNWHGGLHWAEQTIGPRLCPRPFVIDSCAGLNEILDPGPSMKKQEYIKNQAACS
jgi:hypothetical protein